MKQSVLYLVEGVQSCRLDLYTSYGAGNIYDKFQGCTFDVQATAMILINPRDNPVLIVHA